jgi:hypothetical protein
LRSLTCALSLAHQGRDDLWKEFGHDRRRAIA